MKGTNKSDLYLYTCIGGLGHFAESTAKEMQALEFLATKVTQRILIVKQEHPGQYTEFANNVERWMIAFCEAILGMVNDLNQGGVERKKMITKALKTYYEIGSNIPSRSKSKTMENNVNGYLQAFNNE